MVPNTIKGIVSGRAFGHKLFTILQFKSYWVAEVIGRLNCANRTATYQSEIVVQGRTVRCKPSQTILQGLHHLESKFIDLKSLHCKCGEFQSSISRDCRDATM